MSGRYPRWSVTLYHDEPEEASADTMALAHGGPFVTEQDAIEAAQRNIDDHWQTATVDLGTWFPGTLGVRPSRWEYDDDDPAIRVGNGWVER